MRSVVECISAAWKLHKGGHILRITGTCLLGLSLTTCGIMNFIAHIGAVPLGYTTQFIMDVEMCSGSTECVQGRVIKRLQPQAGESRAGRLGSGWVGCNAALWSMGESKGGTYSLGQYLYACV